MKPVVMAEEEITIQEKGMNQVPELNYLGSTIQSDGGQRKRFKTISCKMGSKEED